MDLVNRRQVLINLISRVGRGQQNIYRWVDELIQIDVQLEQHEQEAQRQEQEVQVKMAATASYTHEIECELEIEWVEQLAALLNCGYDGYKLLLTEDQFIKTKKMTPAKWKTLAKKTGYNYDWTEVHIIDCLTFSGPILSPEEKKYKEKIVTIANMNGDDLLQLVKTLPLKDVFVMKSSGGSDVVDIHFTANRTDAVEVQQILFDACIPFLLSSSGKMIECSGKLTRIKREHEQLRKENANRPWFATDRSVRDSM